MAEILRIHVFEMTTEDIDNGVGGECARCAVAETLKRYGWQSVRVRDQFQILAMAPGDDDITRWAGYKPDYSNDALAHMLTNFDNWYDYCHGAADPAPRPKPITFSLVPFEQRDGVKP
jgi:hypothetical protein